MDGRLVQIAFLEGSKVENFDLMPVMTQAADHHRFDHAAAHHRTERPHRRASCVQKRLAGAGGRALRPGDPCGVPAGRGRRGARADGKQRAYRQDHAAPSRREAAADATAGIPAIGLVQLGASVVLLSSAWPITKLALQDGASPLWFAVGRAGLSGLTALFALTVAGRLRRPGRADLPSLLAVGLLQLAGFFALTHAAVAWVPAGRTAILSNVTTIWIVPLSVLLLREAIPLRRWLAAALGRRRHYGADGAVGDRLGAARNGDRAFVPAGIGVLLRAGDDRGALDTAEPVDAGTAALVLRLGDAGVAAARAVARRRPWRVVGRCGLVDGLYRRHSQGRSGPGA